jgi:hypothetical protein
MKDNIERTNENIRNPSQRGDNNNNQRVFISSDIKTAGSRLYYRTNIDGDPTRCDE